MNCNNVRENLIELLAQGPPLDAQADPALTAHVSQCAACTQELESLRKTMALMDEWEAPEPSPYFLTRLRAHVKEEREKAPAKASWFGWVRRPILAVSLTVVLAAGGMFYTLTVVTPPSESPLADVEALDKNHDLIVTTDLVDEISGGPSDDVSDSDI
jgi:anti-sigma factor RsiW